MQSKFCVVPSQKKGLESICNEYKAPASTNHVESTDVIALLLEYTTPTIPLWKAVNRSQCHHDERRSREPDFANLVLSTADREQTVKLKKLDMVYRLL